MGREPQAANSRLGCMFLPRQQALFLLFKGPTVPLAALGIVRTNSKRYNRHSQAKPLTNMMRIRMCDWMTIALWCSLMALGKRKQRVSIQHSAFITKKVARRVTLCRQSQDVAGRGRGEGARGDSWGASTTLDEKQGWISRLAVSFVLFVLLC